MYAHERSLVDEFSGRPFVLLGVNNDGELSTVKKAIKENNLNWRSWYDGSGGPIVEKFKIRSFPTIFILDHNNVIRYKGLRGPLLDQALTKLVTEAEEAGMTGGSEPGPQMREFVDRTGKYKTMAAYMGFENGKVILKKEDQKESKIAWNKLGVEAQQYIAIQRLKEAGLKKIVAAKPEFDFSKPFTFTNKSGSKSIKGTFVGLNDGKAIIFKMNGVEDSIPFSKLSDKSKEFARAELKRMR